MDCKGIRQDIATLREETVRFDMIRLTTSRVGSERYTRLAPPLPRGFKALKFTHGNVVV
jgi:hypothetical protein